MRQARQRNKVKMGPIIFIIGLILAGAFFGIQHLNKNGTLSSIGDSARGTKTITVGVVSDWGGYAGAQYFNGGFDANENSRFYTEYGFKVEFKVIDDLDSSLALWKNGDIDVHWATADAFPTIISGIADQHPRIILQSDWSRGGDMLVATSNVSNISDLRGQRVAVMTNSPSHTFLIKALEASNMTLNDIVIEETSSAKEASDMFVDGDVVAAVVWDASCVDNVRGAKVLTSTKQATHAIPDVFFAKGTWIEENQDIVKGLVEGWMIGNAEINSDRGARDSAVSILGSQFRASPSDCNAMIDNVRLATLGDNKNFFGISDGYNGIGGSDVYNSMRRVYSSIGSAPSNLPRWREIINIDALMSLTLTGVKHEAEPSFTFETATETAQTAEAFASRDVTINFASGQTTLSADAQASLDADVSNALLTFAGARVRVEGNTDSQGDANANRILSQRRAQAVVDYLVNSYGFDSNRFIVVGNGEDKPVATNATSVGRAQNRRTEISFIN